MRVPKAERERLAHLCKHATPGRARVIDNCRINVAAPGGLVHVASTGEVGNRFVDADLIASAWNALPDLLADLDEAEAERETWAQRAMDAMTWQSKHDEQERWRAEKAEAEIARLTYSSVCETCKVQEAEVARLRRLEPYVYHLPRCDYGPGGDCTCGLDAARKESGDADGG